MIRALHVHVPPDLRDAVITLRDEIARDVVRGRIAPLVGGEKLCELHDMFEHAVRTYDRDALGLFLLVQIVDEVHWDEPRSHELLEREVGEECRRILGIADSR